MNSDINTYKEDLLSASEKLKECQKENKTNSCFDCEKLFDCEIRKKYINAVYNSMSKGQSGGFEF
ncbi:MAG: hypothetical protein GXP61_10730 [Epsilonproteobacteria bacterium]|nr:hypothetical protein [Campylobacterota bacterium]